MGHIRGDTFGDRTRRCPADPPLVLRLVVDVEVVGLRLGGVPRVCVVQEVLDAGNRVGPGGCLSREQVFRNDNNREGVVGLRGEH